METSELFKNIIHLPVVSTGLAEEMLAGNFRSIFKGQGMEFDEARHYQIGDDIRSIDWNASARFGTPFVKMYREEKELTLFFLLDISPSMSRGDSFRSYNSDNTKHRDPYEQALLSMALIAFSAERTDQRVGGFFFDKDIEKVFPPRKGRRHIMSLIVSALQYQNSITRRSRHGSNLQSALTGAQRLLKKRSLVVVISDFYTMNWERELTALCRKHDCIALRICDPADWIPSGLITLEDPETGHRMEAPAGMEQFRESWEEWHSERSANWEAQCKRAGASYMEMRTDADVYSSLVKFFGARKKQ